MSQEIQALGQVTTITTRVRGDDVSGEMAKSLAREKLDEERESVSMRELEDLEEEELERLRKDREAMERIVDRMEQFVKEMGRDLQFRVDDDTGKVVVTVKVQGTDEVVRQIPSEEMLAISKRMAEVQGMLFNSSA